MYTAGLPEPFAFWPSVMSAIMHVGTNVPRDYFAVFFSAFEVCTAETFQRRTDWERRHPFRGQVRGGEMSPMAKRWTTNAEARRLSFHEIVRDVGEQDAVVRCRSRRMMTLLVAIQVLAS
jgi:hypothetical protein